MWNQRAAVLVALLAAGVTSGADAIAADAAPELEGSQDAASSGAERGVAPGLPDALSLPARARGAPPPWAGKAFRQGVVAANHPLAAEAGARILEQGGNAVDAAVAVAFALNVVELQNSGVGGAAQILVHFPDGSAWAVDGREKAPAAARRDLYVGKTNFGASGIAVAVPGSLRAAEEALHRWGTKSLAEVLQPAIELAEGGFPIGRRLANALAGSKVSSSPAAIATFRHADGTPLRAGERLVQPLLAKTFKLIAAYGSDVFYRGEIAPAIVEAQRRGRLPGYEGLITLGDLASYDVDVRRPISVKYRGYDVVSFPPSTSGGLVLLESLKLLERFPLGDDAAGFGPGAFRTLNVLVEASRLAHADRIWWSGDDRFYPVPVSGLLSPEYTSERSALIVPDVRLPKVTAGNPLPSEPGSHPELYEQGGGTQTTHFSVVDPHGAIVSYTTTLADGFGTGIFVRDYGFFLNNSGIKFNQTPRLNPATGNPGANDIEPGKRPNGFMAPTILATGGRPFAGFGSPGGDTIPTTVLQIASNLLDHRLSVQDAIDAPRFSYGGGSTVGWEADLPSETIAALRSVGRSLAKKPGAIGSVQAVIVDLQTGKQYGGADARSGGEVVGLPRPHGLHAP
jgi:gamma-glutamyltranspeptidase/glutathione hydrolase